MQLFLRCICIFFSAAGFTADLEITMPIITTEPHLLETALGKLDKLTCFSFNDLLSIFILTAVFGTFPLL